MEHIETVITIHTYRGNFKKVDKFVKQKEKEGFKTQTIDGFSEKMLRSGNEPNLIITLSKLEKF